MKKPEKTGSEKPKSKGVSVIGAIFRKIVLLLFLAVLGFAGYTAYKMWKNGEPLNVDSFFNKVKAARPSGRISILPQ